MRRGPYYWAERRAVLSVVAEPTESANLAESVSAGSVIELSTPLPVTVTESVVVSLEDDPHAVISIVETASISTVFFILVFVYFDY